MTILDLTPRIHRPTIDQRIAQAHDDLDRATFGIAQDRVQKAHSRVERLVRMNYRVGDAVNRVAAWARCATDPNEPTPPRAA